MRVGGSRPLHHSRLSSTSSTALPHKHHHSPATWSSSRGTPTLTRSILPQPDPRLPSDPSAPCTLSPSPIHEIVVGACIKLKWWWGPSAFYRDSLSPTTTMREIRPLLLPQIVAKRQSAGSPRDSMIPLADSAVTHPPSDTSRSHATVSSDCSTPQTPTFSVYGHNRHPSSNSSLGSSPPAHDALESMSSSVKLPKLTEEPIERDVEDEMDADVDMMDDIALCLCKSGSIRTTDFVTNS